MKIRGNTVGTNMPRTNWNQTDPKKADYLNGRDDLVKTIEDVSVKTSNLVDGAVTTAKMADSSVTSAKIADANVTKAKLADGATHTTATASLAVASWSSKAQTVSVSGVTASNTVIVVPAPASNTAYNNAQVYCSAQAAGKLTFKCTTTPTAALTVNVLILT